MSLIIHSDPSVLCLDDVGTIRIAGTRVTLDTLVGEFNKGETPEQIATNFPGLSLADIYTALGYYVRHRAEVEEYIRDAERKFEQFQLKHPEAFALQEQLPARIKARKMS